VYQNGVLLVNGTDVTVTSGTAVVLAVGAVVGDIIQVIGSTTFNYAATVPVSKGGTGLTSPGANGNVLTSDGTNWTSAAPAGVPTGGVIYYPSTTAPTGFLKCDGSIYNRSSYTALAAVIGTPMLPSGTTLRNSGLTVTFANTNGVSVNNLFFAAGSGASNNTSVANAFRTTADGITYTLRTGYVPDGNLIGKVAYFNSLYVMAGTASSGTASVPGNNALYQTSPDGATWTTRSQATSNAGFVNCIVGNQTWGRGVMNTYTSTLDSCTGQYYGSAPNYWFYSTTGTSWTAAASPPTNTHYFDAWNVVAGSSGVVATSNNPTANTVWYSADGSTYSNISSYFTSTFGVATIYRVIWTGTYFYMFCDTGILLRSTTGASGSWSLATATLGLGDTTSTNPYNSIPDNLTYRYATDGTYHIIGNNSAGRFWFSADFVNWSYAQGRSGFFRGVVGSTFITLSTSSTSMSTYTFSGTGYTTATQFPVPNLGIPPSGASGTAAPPPVPYIKT
jgi:hypothetical protein